MLLTSLAISTFEECCTAIGYYCCRWEIEVFFRVLKSGCKIEELQFQRPQAEVELARADAERRSIKTGDQVTLAGGGASVTLRARVNKNLSAGVVRVAREHAGGVLGTVEVTPAGVTA